MSLILMLAVGAVSRKSDFSHASNAAGMLQACRNDMKPHFDVAITHWKSGFIAYGHGGPS